MLGRTHIVGGTASLWVLAALPHGLDPVGLCVCAAVLGALLPDMDAETSLLQRIEIRGIRPLLFIGPLVSQSLGHRGPLHSLFGLYAVAAGIGPLVAAWLGWQVAVAIALGYASHLALDLCTVSGLRLCWPSRRTYWLLPEGARFRTKTPITDREQGLDIVLLLLTLALLALQLLSLWQP